MAAPGSTSEHALRNKYSPLQVAGPLPGDMVRSIPAIVRAPHLFLTDVTTRHGPAAAIPMPRTPVLVLADPDGVRRVLVDNARDYGKATIQYSALATVTGPGLLAGDGTRWRTHRRVVQPAFHHSGLRDVAVHAVHAGQRLAVEADAAGGAPIDVLDATSRAGLEVVGHTLAAADLSGDAPALVGAVGRALELVVRRAASPVPASWPTPSRRRLAREVATVDDLCARILADRAARPLDDPHDLVGLMLAAGMDDRQIRDELVTFVVAGHETVASSLTWTLDLLSRNPSALAAVHAELDGLPADPTWDDVPQLPYLRACVDEALRLYPPAWVITRKALAPDRLDVAGTVVDVPAGTLVIVCTWALHRDPGRWEEPGLFRPERFLDAAERRRDDYVPFGAGPRLCIGRDLALVEEVLVLATLLRTRTLRPVPGPPPRVDALVTLRPRGGLRLHVERR
ncbi:cytochrome P450 [Kineococcus rhizosphaerae]|uniref:Cytochrome P450 n=1 Tax=Kineococcus rhizosphaerae TaxID=559628 RepID=A0A2T0R3S9_9ACTN|nr:cytochrome P450 [Kineococcus rhizosphaerae]PRY14712.1 cytochrome P450 [Kineococcus rhizosphaerae]